MFSKWLFIRFTPRKYSLLECCKMYEQRKFLFQTKFFFFLFCVLHLYRKNFLFRIVFSTKYIKKGVSLCPCVFYNLVIRKRARWASIEDDDLLSVTVGTLCIMLLIGIWSFQKKIKNLFQWVINFTATCVYVHIYNNIMKRQPFRA